MRIQIEVGSNLSNFRTSGRSSTTSWFITCKKHDLNCKNQKVIDSNDKSENVHHPTFLLDKQHWLMAVNL
jgi:hypothetical protein